MASRFGKPVPVASAVAERKAGPTVDKKPTRQFAHPREKRQLDLARVEAHLQMVFEKAGQFPPFRYHGRVEEPSRKTKADLTSFGVERGEPKRPRLDQQQGIRRVDARIPTAKKVNTCSSRSMFCFCFSFVDPLKPCVRLGLWVRRWKIFTKLWENFAMDRLISTSLLRKNRRYPYVVKCDPLELKFVEIFNANLL